MVGAYALPIQMWQGDCASRLPDVRIWWLSGQWPQTMRAQPVGSLYFPDPLGIALAAYVSNKPPLERVGVFVFLGDDALGVPAVIFSFSHWIYGKIIMHPVRGVEVPPPTITKPLQILEGFAYFNLFSNV